MEGRIGRLLKDCKWTYPKDVSIDSFVRWSTQHEAAPKTLNEYLNAIELEDQKWWARWDLNPRPNDYESFALTTELQALSYLFVNICFF